ncbi:hypothetical protein H072_2017 [Dactylellina haptotyla CBS 200.50]|uniref:Uncharacterized protein n=1 Tax=Dactylellina haptotyla (strain CBS 200.50) TaxID=1284197 RepID=S8BWY9_DACHA|nr:hypothetical protein H072_2017 [Dactylellina haptotyla CBS 200.50]
MSEVDIVIAGATAAFAIDLIIYPLDTVKTRIQSAAKWPGGTRGLYKGAYQGVGSVILATLPSSATFFLTYNFLVRNISIILLPSNDEKSPQVLRSAIHSLSSAIAETVSCAILTPAEVIKQNAQVVSPTSQATASSSLIALRMLVQQPKKLLRGYSALLSRNLPFTAIHFPLYEEMRRNIYQHEGITNPSLSEVGVVTAISAGSAGAIAATITTPLDVVKTRMMLLRGGNSSSAGMLETAKSIVRSEGARAIWRGGLLRAVWTAGLTTFAHFFQYFRYRAWFITVLLLAGIMQTFGYLARLFSARDVQNRGLYIAQFVLVVLAPLFTAAGDYIILGRLLERVLPGGRRAKTLGLPARWITWIFVTSDIISFVMQGLGAAIISANTDGKNPAAQERGTHIIMAGLVVQIAFFSFFVCAVIRFDLKTRAAFPNVKWRTLVYCLYLSCTLILIRSIYRTVEFAQGWNGYLMGHEVYFYVLEALPMLPCLLIFNIFHPSKYLPEPKSAEEDVNLESQPSYINNSRDGVVQIASPYQQF